MTEIGKLIMERKIGAAESAMLSLSQAAINQAMYRLDIELHRSTLKWGVGRLLALAPAELVAKWDAQMVKLNAAILADEVPLVEDLVVGSCRGVAALERSVVAAGHVPFSPEFKEIAMDDGTVYRVVDDFAAAGAISSTAERPVVSIGELVRGYHARHQETFKRPVREVGKEYVASGKPMDEALPF